MEYIPVCCICLSGNDSLSIDGIKVENDKIHLDFSNLLKKNRNA